jgi:nitrogen regulatory protein P-II 1
MNEVKAFIRKRRTEEVVDKLEENGFCCMTIIDVMGLGNLSDPRHSQISINIATRFSEIVKLVVVCKDEHTDQVINLITEGARSGSPGDGIIYVTPVSKTVHIRTGKKGGDFLQHPRQNH